MQQRKQGAPAPAATRSLTDGRIPPQAPDIEAQILGALLLEPNSIATVVALLEPDAFYVDAHRKIYQAAVHLFERGIGLDTITLAEELRRRGHLELVGGEVRLVELSVHVSSARHIEDHARLVLEKAMLRGVITTGASLVHRGYDPSQDALELVEEAEQEIFSIAEKRLQRHAVSMQTAVHKAVEMMERIHGNHSGVTGIPTGFERLDNITGGWQAADLVVIAGRPSSGKTALALTLARNAALHQERPTPVGIFSLEMSTEQLVVRLLCAEAKVDAHAVRVGRMSDEDWRRVSLAAARVSAAGLWIDDTASMGLLEVKAKARRLRAEHGIGMLVIDYLQLMQGPRGSENREKEIAAISRGLKALAKELGIPVLALSQLSRALEARTDKRPMLSDLRESGAIEQDADVVVFVHRPEMYLERGSDEYEQAHGKAEVIVGKQRNGPTDDVELTFVHRYARFENPAVDFHPEEPSLF